MAKGTWAVTRDDDGAHLCDVDLVQAVDGANHGSARVLHWMQESALDRTAWWGAGLMGQLTIGDADGVGLAFLSVSGEGASGRLRDGTHGTPISMKRYVPEETNTIGHQLTGFWRMDGERMELTEKVFRDGFLVRNGLNNLTGSKIVSWAPRHNGMTLKDALGKETNWTMFVDKGAVNLRQTPGKVLLIR